MSAFSVPAQGDEYRHGRQVRADGLYPKGIQRPQAGATHGTHAHRRLCVRKRPARAAPLVVGAGRIHPLVRPLVALHRLRVPILSPAHPRCGLVSRRRRGTVRVHAGRAHRNAPSSPTARYPWESHSPIIRVRGNCRQYGGVFEYCRFSSGRVVTFARACKPGADLA
jgi:hypothetical protein